MEFFPYALPLKTPYRWAKGEQHERCGLLAKLAGDGAAGWGETAPPPHEAVDGPALAAAAAALVAGLDLDRDDFLDRLDERAPPMRLRAAIATAWLSWHAARDGKSLGAYLGGAARPPAAQVPINALDTDADADRAADSATRFVAQGHRTLKIKCSADRAGDRARVAAIRVAVPDAVLRLDANESWDPDWAAAHLRDLAAYRIDYVEQPIPAGPPGELARIRRDGGVGIAADEAAQNAEAIRGLLDAEAVDALILKPQRLGGPDRTLEIIRLAESHGVRCTVTNSLETAIGVTAALHCASLMTQPIPDCGLATSRFFARDVAAPPTIVDGYMAVPTAFGLGVETSPEIVAAGGMAVP